MADCKKTAARKDSHATVQAIAARIIENPEEAALWRAHACGSLPCDCPRTEAARARCPIHNPTLLG